MPRHGDCTFLADPADDPLVKPACWRVESSPFVVRIDGPRGEIRIQGTRLQRDILIGNMRHLVLRGNFGAHRIELAINARCTTPSVTLGLDASVTVRLGCVAALASGLPDLPPPLRPTPYQTTRLGLMLAILDRLGDETSGLVRLRAIANELAYPGTNIPGRAIEWKSSSIRRQTQRLVATARWLRDGGYRRLLLGQIGAGRISEPTCIVGDDAPS